MFRRFIFQGFTFQSNIYTSSVVMNTDIPMQNYQSFFKNIYKSSKARETIAIYEEHQQLSEKQPKYLTVTFRMLTRLLRKGNIQENFLVNNFIKKHFESIKLLETSDVHINDLKYVILFALTHLSFNKDMVTPQFVDFTRKVLKNYLQKHQQLSDDDKLRYIQIITSSIKQISLNFSDLTDEFSTILIDCFRKHKEQLVIEHLTFRTALEALDQSFSPNNTQIFSLIQEIAEYVMNSNLIPTFDQTTLGYLINICYKCDSEIRARGLEAKPKIIELINKIDQYLMDSLSKINGNAIQIIIPILLKYNPKGKFVTHYYQIIALSLNQKGYTFLSPLLIVESVSFLSSSQMSLLTDVRSQWEQYFLNFLRFYYHPKNQYQRNIYCFLNEIYIKKILKPENQVAFKKFCDQSQFFIEKSSKRVENIQLIHQEQSANKHYPSFPKETVNKSKKMFKRK